MKTIVGVLMMALSAAASGQVLKCTSENGKVEFASVCPPGTTAHRTGIHNDSSISNSSAPGKSLAEREAEFRKRLADKQEASAKAEKEAAASAQRAAACNNARSYLKALQAGNRIVRTDPNTGERSYLQDAQYGGEIANAQRSVNANCGT